MGKTGAFGIPDMTHEYFCTDCGIPCCGSIASFRCSTCQEIANRETYRRSRERQANGTSRRKNQIYKCQRCGGDYILNSGNQRYCKECAPYAMVENKQEKSMQYREQHREEINAKKRVTPVEIKCEVCGKSFTVTNKRQRVCSDGCRVIYRKRQTIRLMSK